MFKKGMEIKKDEICNKEKEEGNLEEMGGDDVKIRNAGDGEEGKVDKEVDEKDKINFIYTTLTFDRLRLPASE